MAAVSVMSTVVTFQRPMAAPSVNSARTPAYESAGTTTCAPAGTRSRIAAAAAIPEPKETAVPPSSAPTAASSACQLAVPPSREYSVTGASAIPDRKFEASTSGTFIGRPGSAGGRPAVTATVSGRSCRGRPAGSVISEA